MIRITSKIDGFRRAGVAHSSRPSDYPDGYFSDKQLAQLEAEPNLIVQHLANPAAADESDDQGAGEQAGGKKAPTKTAAKAGAK